MKLIIDIPEKIEEYIKDYIPIGAGNNVFCYPDEIVRMIQNGTPIPDNVTNGDVIKAMFPDAEIHFNENDVFFHHMGFWIKCNIRWWNAPYQKGGKE